MRATMYGRLDRVLLSQIEYVVTSWNSCSSFISLRLVTSKPVTPIDVIVDAIQKYEHNKANQTNPIPLVY